MGRLLEKLAAAGRTQVYVFDVTSSQILRTIGLKDPASFQHLAVSTTGSLARCFRGFCECHLFNEIFPVGRTVSPLFDTSQLVLPGAASTPPDGPEEAPASSAAAAAAAQGRLFNRAASEASSSRWARSQRSQRRSQGQGPIHIKKVNYYD